MKKVILGSVFFIAILIVFNGCKKYLDIDPPYTQDAENYFQNES